MRALVRSLVVACCATGMLAGCSGGSQAIYDTAASLWGGPSAADRAKLDPNLRYLRVTVGRRAALLVLGYVDAHPQGPIEVWYSAERQVLKLQHGRLVGATGLATEWRSVAHLPLPDWAELIGRTQPLDWTRRRDVMPGYRYGVVDQLRLARIDPPDDSRYIGTNAASLVWFEETLAPDARGEVALPPGRYAIDPRAIGDPVVYGEACLAQDLCLAWQRWPAPAPSAAAR